MARTAIGTNDHRSQAIGGPAFVSGVVYSGALACDIWKPGVANRPAIIFLHGGAWAATPQTRNNPALYQRIARMFAERGFAVVNADYTPANGTPGTAVTDCKNLVAWVRTNAATYNIDATRVAIAGISSGGWTGLMAAIQGITGTSRPNAVVAWSPPADLVASHPIATANIERLMGVPLVGNEALYIANSPTEIVTSACCPLRIVGSDDEENASDPGPNVEQFNDMETAALAAGVSVTKRIFAGRLHGQFDGSISSATNDLLASCAWLARTLGEITPVSSRTASVGRTASVARTAA